MNKNELRKATEEAVKKANNRLDKLERNGYSGSSSAYRYIEKEHYKGDKALKETKTGKMRFKTDLRKLTYNQLAHLYNMASGFNEAKTSTKTGINRLTSDSYNKSPLRHTMSKQQYAEYWQDSNVQAFSKLYGSDYVQKLATKTENAQEIASRVMKYYNETGELLSIMSIENMKDAPPENDGFLFVEDNDNPFEV